jgi:hypothetical protein
LFTYKPCAGHIIHDTMDRYIQQLIEDFHQATLKIIPPSEIWNDVDITSEIDVEDIAYLEEEFYGTEQPLSEIVGIPREQLPPLYQLTDQQITLLVEEMIKLLHYFNFNPVIPDGVDDKTIYQLLCDTWDCERVYVSFGEVDIEYCDHDEEFCPFSGCCTICSDYEEECRLDEQRRNRLNDDCDNGPSWLYDDPSPDDLNNNDDIPDLLLGLDLI